MPSTLIYPAGSTAACGYAAGVLAASGFSLTDHPTPEITHLLLDVPSFRPDGLLRDGTDPERLLSMLPAHITVVGGNLNQPVLSGYRQLDLLSDPEYLARNAAITAHCALKVAAPLLKTTFSDTPTLILGWGRIGKCLASLLRGMDCPVTVAARKEADRAMLRALGYGAVDFSTLPGLLPQFRLLFNTVPVNLFDAFPPNGNCIRIELASGGAPADPDVIIARGLPGIHAPESSGRLIAQTIFRLWKEQSK